MSASNSARLPLLILMSAYYPFLGLVCLFGASLAFVCFWIAYQLPLVLGAFFVIPGALLGLTVLHILLSLPALWNTKMDKDHLELLVPEQWIPGLCRLVDRVAKENDVDPPDDIDR